MADFWRMLGVGLLGAVLAMTLRQQHQALGFAVAAFAGAIVLGFALDRLQDAAGVFSQIAAYAQLQDEQVQLILKLLGVSLIVELAAQVCRDAGEAGLALHIETGGKMLLLLLSAPMLLRIAALVLELTA